MAGLRWSRVKAGRSFLIRFYAYGNGAIRRIFLKNLMTVFNRGIYLLC